MNGLAPIQFVGLTPTMVVVTVVVCVAVVIALVVAIPKLFRK